MLLSILIPIFNQNVTKLVTALHTQAIASGTVFEILCYDDHSKIHFVENESLNNLIGVKYVQLTENIGRAAIRNKLAKESRGAYLLFLDCDADVIREDFIKKYLLEKVENGVVCGGTAYTKFMEENHKDAFYLHRLYGEKREAIGLTRRLQNPYSSFKTFQFLADRNVFDRVVFDETLLQYGHEDTLFGIELKTQNIELKHIDNPAVHTGLETNVVFLQKNKKALENLIQLEKRFPELHREIKVLKVYKQLKKFGLHYILRRFEGYFYRKLLNENPFLYQFDVWKLTVLSDISLPLHG